MADLAISRIHADIQVIKEGYAVDMMHVLAWEKVMDVVKREPALSWSQQARADRVGVHKANRGGLGLSKAKALTLGSANCENGYNYTIASADVCASTIDNENRLYNLDLDKKQDLPP